MNSAGNLPLSAAFQGRVALVTGGGRGIGAATAELLLERGARVLFCARTGSEVGSTEKRLAERFGTANVVGRVADLADPAVFPSLFDEAERRFGAPVRVLVNNAAIGYAIPFLETSPAKLREEWDRMAAINIRAPLLLAHEFLRRFPRGDREGGAIVSLASLGGVAGTEKFPGLTPYVATKFAVIGLTEAIAVEARPLGVRVNAVAPGAVDTEMLRKAAPHLRTETRPADVAKTIVDLCARDVTGTVVEIHSNL
ncbi:MAG: SDR family oxidoreductase [Bdellovibrionales bacterium]|nr:SDR family oxidoreductase [Bdellovibrionales bacterium]